MKTNPTYSEALKLISQLPENDFEKLLAVMKNGKYHLPSAKRFKEEFLLSAPVMSATQFKQYQKFRRQFNQWRRN